MFDVLKTDLKDDVVSKQCCESYISCVECNKMKAKTYKIGRHDRRSSEVKTSSQFECSFYPGWFLIFTSFEALNGGGGGRAGMERGGLPRVAPYSFSLPPFMPATQASYTFPWSKCLLSLVITTMLFFSMRRLLLGGLEQFSKVMQTRLRLGFA